MAVSAFTDWIPTRGATNEPGSQVVTLAGNSLLYSSPEFGHAYGEEQPGGVIVGFSAYVFVV